MNILITGAAGFVGRALAKRLLAGAMPVERLTLLDVTHGETSADARVRALTGDIGETAVRAHALAGGVDAVFHLAGVLSAISEKDYALSRQINLDATLSLFEETVQAAHRPRMVYTSSIAVFGAPLPAKVDDDTAPVPSLVYGAHKRMCEIALADLSRRAALDGIAVRLSGILARPFGGTTTKSAFISDIFHAFARNQPFVSPVSRGAKFWCMSVSRCVDNLIHAAQMKLDGLPRGRALTLPALRLGIPQLADALAAATGNDRGLVTYEPDQDIETTFGGYPPLATPAADALGFHHDGDVDELVRSVLENLRSS